MGIDLGDARSAPDDPLGFIRECVRNQRVLWTYHVNMRLRSRGISREVVYEAVGRYEIIEAYPQDKYLPSYLVWMCRGPQVLHVLFAVDVEGGNVRVVAAYRPEPTEWIDGLKRRRTK